MVPPRLDAASGSIRVSVVIGSGWGSDAIKPCRLSTVYKPLLIGNRFILAYDWSVFVEQVYE